MFPPRLIAAKVGTHLPDYTESHNTRQQSSRSSPSEPKVSRNQSVLLTITNAGVCKIYLTPLSRVLPEKLAAAQLVTILTPRFTTVFT